MSFNKFLFVFIVMLASVANAQLTPAELKRFQYEFTTDIYKKYADAIVYVTGEFSDPTRKELKAFFKFPKQKSSESIGTGFFITEDGYVITNAHGVFKSVSAVVEMRDKKRFDAQVVGFILEDDLALLKIDPGKPVTAIKFREESEIAVGEPIASISHPHGLKYTCTQGIVSASGRRSLLSDIGVTIDDLLQTDMSINPGSSGGPWFDVTGRVVALTTSRRGGSDNIAFGVSAQKILNRLPDLFDYPHRNGFVRGFSLALKNGDVVVKDLDDSSTAAKAGVKNGDKIVAVNGTNVSGMMSYLNLEEKFSAGQKVTLTVNGQNEKQVQFSLEKWNEPDVNDELWKRIGIKVRNLTRQEFKACHLKSAFAYVITEVDQERFGSLQDQIKPGDILGQIAGVRPESLSELNRLLTRIKPQSRVDIVVLRAVITGSKKPLTLTPDELNQPEKENPDLDSVSITKTRINISSYLVK